MEDTLSGPSQEDLGSAPVRCLDVSKSGNEACQLRASCDCHSCVDRFFVQDLFARLLLRFSSHFYFAIAV